MNTDEMLKMGVDDVYCISVNDAFVMRQWGIVQGLVEDKNIDNPDPKCPLNPGNFTTIKLIPDGAAKFTKAMGMNCKSPAVCTAHISVQQAFLLRHSCIFSLSGMWLAGNVMFSISPLVVAPLTWVLSFQRAAGKWENIGGFGERSWRYSAVFNDMKIEKLFLEVRFRLPFVACLFGPSVARYHACAPLP
jgi:peroxiredoxin